MKSLPSGLRKKFENRLSKPLRYSSGALIVGLWKEPNDWEHRNYCGPGATQVALDARLPASQVPDIDTIGEEENIDPDWGIYISAIKPVLNDRLNTGWYVYDSDIGSEWTLFWRTIFDVDRGWALTTGCVTNQMPGWSTDANHIVAVVGYIDSDDYTDCISYTETAGSVAGYYGDYWQMVSKGDMWQYVEENDAMVW